MPEILTESFCERCGTRYTFQSTAPKVGRLAKIKVLSRGLKNYVLSDETSLDEALSDARSTDDRQHSVEQLDAFHKTFNFCMSCRQYTCGNCWNDLEGRCLSCAPSLSVGVLPSSYPTLNPVAGIGAIGGNGNGHTPALEMDAFPADPTAWPEVDLASAPDQPAGIEPSLSSGAAVKPVSRLEALFGREAAARIEANAPRTEGDESEMIGLEDLRAEDLEPAEADVATVAADVDADAGEDEEAVAAVAEAPDVAAVVAAPDVAAEADELDVEADAAGALEVEATDAPDVAGEAEELEVAAAATHDVLTMAVGKADADADATAAAEPVAEPTRAALTSAEKAVAADELAERPAAEEPAEEVAEEPVAADERIAAIAAVAATAEEPEADSLAPAAELGVPLATVLPVDPETDELAAAAAAQTHGLLDKFRARPEAMPTPKPTTTPWTVPAPAARPAAPAYPAFSLPTTAPTAPAAPQMPYAASGQPMPQATPQPYGTPTAYPAPTPPPYGGAQAYPAQAAQPYPGPAQPPYVAPVQPYPAPASPYAAQTQPSPYPTIQPQYAAPAPPPTPAAPSWRMVAPEGPWVASAPSNGHVHEPGPASTGPEPQWPAAPAWPAPVARTSRTRGAEAVWAESTRDLLNRPETGVSACFNCGLPLSATARFCRRCGTSQVNS